MMLERDYESQEQGAADYLLSLEDNQNDSYQLEHVGERDLVSTLTKKHKYRPDRHQNSKWTTEEGHKLLEIVSTHGAKNWKNIACILGGDRTGDCLSLHTTRLL